MRLLKAGLERHGLEVLATSHARNNWPNDPPFLKALATADLIIINGEGTLHHGKPAGRLLLNVVDHAKNTDCPVAVINALYHSNPGSWGPALAGCALLSARDSKSAAEMRSVSNDTPVRVVPDISLSGGALAVDSDRSNVVVGDAVRLRARNDLARLALRVKADSYLPIKTLVSPILRAPMIGQTATWILFNAYNAVLAIRQPTFTLAQSEAEYISAISQARIHVTGRYHSVCFSVMTGIPFLAISSNSWKIEALLDDIGIGRGRVLSIEDIGTIKQSQLDRPFSFEELEKLAAYLSRAVKTAEQLFADLAQLAFDRSKRR